MCLPAAIFFSFLSASGFLCARLCGAKEKTRLYPVEQCGKWGYIDRKGAMVIRPKFDDAWAFSEDLAAVEMGGSLGIY